MTNKTFHLQNVLDRMAQTGRFGKCSIQHIKMFLSDVFVLAAQQGFFYGANPATDTSIPKVREPEETHPYTLHAYTLEEVVTMIDALPEPAATMVAAAAFTGVRRGTARDAMGELRECRNRQETVAHRAFHPERENWQAKEQKV